METAPERARGMDSKEIDIAMRNRIPVIYEDVKYDYIEEYTSKWKDGKRLLSAGLRLGRSLYRVPADKVQPLRGEQGLNVEIEITEACQ